MRNCSFHCMLRKLHETKSKNIIFPEWPIYMSSDCRTYFQKCYHCFTYRTLLYRIFYIVSFSSQNNCRLVNLRTSWYRIISVEGNIHIPKDQRKQMHLCVNQICEDVEQWYASTNQRRNSFVSWEVHFSGELLLMWNVRYWTFWQATNRSSSSRCSCLFQWRQYHTNIIYTSRTEKYQSPQKFIQLQSIYSLDIYSPQLSLSL